MNNLIIPPVNLEGTFKLKTPLTSLINENVVYTVDKVVNISALIEDSIDVETIVFKDQGLKSDDYKYCLLNKIPIVTLKSEGNFLVDIPANYFSYVPQITGKIFINRAIIVNLGYIPKELDLDYIKTELNDYVVERTGINAESSLEDISGDLILSYQEADDYEADRTSRIKITSTCRGMLLDAQNTINTYKLKIAALVKKVYS